MRNYFNVMDNYGAHTNQKNVTSKLLKMEW